MMINRTSRSVSIAVVVAAIGGTMWLTSSNAESQTSLLKESVALQGASPGFSQSGNANISGTMRAGQFIGGGSGLTGLSSSSLAWPLIYSGVRNAANKGLIEVVNTSTTFGATAISGRTNQSQTAGITGIDGPDPVSGTVGTRSGVFGRSVNGLGVFGYSDTYVGVLGSGSSDDTQTTGVQGLTISTNGLGVHAFANVGTATGLLAEGPVNGYGARINGRTLINGNTFIAPAAVTPMGSASLFVGDSTGTGFEGVTSFASSTGEPFFGYALGGAVTTYTYVNSSDGSFRLNLGSDRLTVQNDGDVGIGTSTPAARLHVSGGSIINDFSTGATTGKPSLEIANGGTLSLALNWKWGAVAYAGPSGGTGANHIGFASFAAGGSSENRAVSGSASTTSTGTNIGIWGNALNGATNWAGYFQGAIFGSTASAGVKAFLIDHPDDPENRYLEHSSIESNERMNLYRGQIVTDSRGYASVTVPSWFASLNGDIQYQLTVIDEADSESFVQAKIVRRLQNGSFRIRTSAPGATVNWQLSGVRIDPVAKHYPLEIEREKPAHERGRLLFPEAYGFGPDRAMHQSGENESVGTHQGRTSR